MDYDDVDDDSDSCNVNNTTSAITNNTDEDDFDNNDNLNDNPLKDVTHMLLCRSSVITSSIKYWLTLNYKSADLSNVTMI